MQRTAFREVAFFLGYCVVVFGVLATIGLVRAWIDGYFDPSMGGSPEQFQHIVYVRPVPIIVIAGAWGLLRAWWVLRNRRPGL